MDSTAPPRIAVKNWRQFQHYKHRRPPWIKLHRELLDDHAFMRLPLASIALAPLCWLLASESEDGSIPADLEELVFRLHRSKDEIEEGLRGLVSVGLLVDASGALATRKQVATTEKRQRRDRVETDTVAGAPVWNRTACDLWNSKYGKGSAHGGRIGAALKPLVGAHGAPAVLTAWARYLAETKHPSPSPQDFQAHFGSWAGNGTSGGSGAAMGGAPTRAAEDWQIQDALKKRGANK